MIFLTFRDFLWLFVGWPSCASTMFCLHFLFTCKGTFLKCDFSWLFVTFWVLFSDVYCRLLILPTWSQIQIETCVNDAYYNDWSLNNRPSRISLEDTDGMASNQGNYTLPIVTWTWNFQFCNWEIQVGNWKFIWMSVIKWNLISEWLLAHVNWKLQ